MLIVHDSKKPKKTAVSRKRTSKKSKRQEAALNYNDEEGLKESLGTSKPRKTKATSSKSRQKKPCLTVPRSAVGDQAKRLEKMTASNPQGLAFRNLFDSVRENDGAAEMPTFNATTRDDALKQMLESFKREDRRTAKIDLDKLDAAAKSFTGRGTCKPTSNSEWKIEGMSSTLTSYQMVGVAFMRGRETGGVEPRGGIQADAMGFGSKQIPKRP